MGEDLFWAIRGGGGNTFGIVLAWKLKLVPVPPVLTVFTVNKNLEQNATKIFHRCQVGKKTVQASFKAMFLGGVDELIPLIQHKFPGLGLAKENCTEMSWIESVLHFGELPIQPVDILLNRNVPRSSLKAKTDFVKEPIPETGTEGFMSMFLEEEADIAITMIVALGGKMYEIPENKIPFPNKVGNLFIAIYIAAMAE
ncbi:berberine bridge enzyme-like 23 [Gossypium arboreum]|uniref:berberine bridge enzyme-like 23 n=1 Tax=Gossypium arboreum TaxID=29729 RepID=UPI0008196F46|nr:berberine bridge enzyme-like 23 [Gossypium arboreum]